LQGVSQQIKKKAAIDAKQSERGQAHKQNQDGREIQIDHSSRETLHGSSLQANYELNVFSKSLPLDGASGRGTEGANSRGDQNANPFAPREFPDLRQHMLSYLHHRRAGKAAEASADLR
jgi:hypothetical protein